MYVGKCLRKGASLLQMPLESDLKPSVSKQSCSPPRLTPVHSHVLLPQKDAELAWRDDCDPVSLSSMEASHGTAGRIQQVRTGGKALPLYGAVTSQRWSHQERVSCFFTQAVHIPHRLRGGVPSPESSVLPARSLNGPRMNGCLGSECTFLLVIFNPMV